MLAFVISVQYSGRLGNRLFQYCLARILAERLGYRLQAKPIPGFPGTLERIDGSSYEGPEVNLTGQIIDFQSILRDKQPRKIHLHGHFQLLEYYQDHFDSIQKWLRPPESGTAAKAPTRLVLHIRRGDYVRFKHALPFSFYEEAVEKIVRPGERITIFTDDPYDPFFLHFRKWKPFYPRGTELEDFTTMRNAEHLVLSQSSFSWWAAVLGKAETIIAPDPLHGFWARNNKYGITLMEHPRFTRLSCRERYKPNYLEKKYIKWRRRHKELLLYLNERLGCNFKIPVY